MTVSFDLFQGHALVVEDAVVLLSCAQAGNQSIEQNVIVGVTCLTCFFGSRPMPHDQISGVGLKNLASERGKAAGRVTLWRLGRLWSCLRRCKTSL